MSVVPLDIWGKAFKTIYGRSPRKSTDFELVSGASGKKANQENGTRKNSSQRSLSLTKLKRSAQEYAGLMPLTEKVESHSSKVKVSRMDSKTAVNGAAISSASNSYGYGLTRNHGLQCSMARSPLKRLQQTMMIESPQKASPLRASTASLFINNLLYHESENPIVGHHQVESETAAALLQKQWDDELSPLMAADGGNRSSGEMKTDSVGCGVQRPDGYKTMKKSRRGKKASALQLETVINPKNFVRLKITKKQYVRGYKKKYYAKFKLTGKKLRHHI